MKLNSVNEILTAVRDKKVSATEITNHYLSLIKKNNDEFNCFITLTEEIALEKAKEVGHIDEVFEKLASNLDLVIKETDEIQAV